MERYSSGSGEQPPVKTPQQLLSEFEETVSTLEPGVKKMKAEKALAILRLTLSTYDNVTNELRKLPSSKKKILKAINRRPRKKAKTQSIMVSIFAQSNAASVQMNIIAATPIPNCINGTPSAPGGFAFPNELMFRKLSDEELRERNKPIAEMIEQYTGHKVSDPAKIAIHLGDHKEATDDDFTVKLTINKDDIAALRTTPSHK